MSINGSKRFRLVCINNFLLILYCVSLLFISIWYKSLRFELQKKEQNRCSVKFVMFFTAFGGFSRVTFQVRKLLNNDLLKSKTFIKFAARSRSRC